MAQLAVQVEPGATESRELVIDAKRTISFMGEKFRVYATPEIVWDAEMLCRDLLLQHLPPGHDSVGSRVEIDHLSAGLPGSTVRIEAIVTEVAGRRVTFGFEVRDAIEVIATGRHERVAVALPATLERLALKRRRLGQP
jgi:fluoroacetyl-CoA thioesterase